jgi:transcriptional regulator with XRE-family HTH domain
MRFIRERRRAKGLTQERLAKRIGVTKGTVSSWESGRFIPTPRLVPHLARALGVAALDLEKRIESGDEPLAPGAMAA